jgi:hypothetical protein
MNLQDLTIEKNTAELYYEIDNIEFHLEIGWHFEYFNKDTNECKIHVYLQNGYQWVNGFQHPYFSSIEEIKEIKKAIEEVVFEDPLNFITDDWIQIEKDFYSERININEQ